MAYITDGKTLCRDMWPCNAGRVSEEAENAETIPKGRILPSTYERLCERITVEGLSSLRPRVMIIDPETHTRTELSVRLVGVVGKASLSLRGDWKGAEQDAIKAMQSLSLVNYGCRPAFAHQRNAMANLEELVLSMMNQQGGAHVVEKGTIQLKRRAFTKAADGVKSIKVFDSDDLATEIKAMSKRWVVDHRIATAVAEGSGTLALVSPYAIRRGDLVNVVATVEVVNMRGRRGRKTEVMLCPRQVIRLKTASEIKRILGQARREELAATGTTEATEDMLAVGDTSAWMTELGQVAMETEGATGADVTNDEGFLTEAVH